MPTLFFETAPEILKPFLASALPDFSQSSLLLCKFIIFLHLKNDYCKAYSSLNHTAKESKRKQKEANCVVMGSMTLMIKGKPGLGIKLETARLAFTETQTPCSCLFLSFQIPGIMAWLKLSHLEGVPKPSCYFGLLFPARSLSFIVKAGSCDLLASNPFYICSPGEGRNKARKTILSFMEYRWYIKH